VGLGGHAFILQRALVLPADDGGDARVAPEVQAFPRILTNCTKVLFWRAMTTPIVSRRGRPRR
jgi:hypothetical protein